MENNKTRDSLNLKSIFESSLKLRLIISSVFLFAIAVSFNTLFTFTSLEKLYKEMFYQADFILKKAGKITILIQKENLLLEIGKKYKFKHINKKEILLGKQKAIAITLTKGV